MDTKTRGRILAEARSWLGTPFHHKGRVKHVGVDCGGYIYGVYCQFLQLKPFPEHYAEDWTLHRSEEIYMDFIGEYVVEVPSPRPAGLALFKVGRCYGHGAICTERRTLLHAWGRTKHGCVQEKERGFFQDKSGKLLPVKFFDLR